MNNEVLIAIFSKMIEERLSSLPNPSRGPRGPSGPKGEDGKGFVFSDHVEEIKKWVKDYSLKFSDLTSDEISALRGPKGRDGKDGQPGKNFAFSENKEQIEEIIHAHVDSLSDSLKLKFSDLSSSEVEELRGPRGRDGKDGKSFIFDEHVDFFKTLKLKFSDLSEEEKSSLALKFSNLTDEEKSLLKLRFSDLTEDDRAQLKGPRGVRGQRGQAGRDGVDGKDGLNGKDGTSVRGLPGPIGMQGRPGKDGIKGLNGIDAPRVIDVTVKQRNKQIYFVFEFSDGSEIETNAIELPGSDTRYVYSSSGGYSPPSEGGGGSGTIESITSTNPSLTVDNPTGPNVQLNLDTSSLAAAKLELVLTSGEAIPARSAVYYNYASGKVFLADKTTFDTSLVIGIARTSAAGPDMPVTIVTNGNLVDAGFGFTANGLIYLQTGGAISDAVPTTGHRVVVGKSLLNTTLFINVLEPIVLA